MDVETIRIIISVVALVMIAFIWRLLHLIHRQIQRICKRLDGEARAIHYLTECRDEEENRGHLHGLRRL